MLVLKISLNEWKNESRDQKELLVCKTLGADIKVVAKSCKENNCKRIDYVDGFEVHRLPSRPFRHLPASFNRVLSIFVWAKYVKEMHPDIISGHDLYGLTIGWLSTLFLKQAYKPKLVYDSHEFEIGRNVRRSRVQTKIVMFWEHFMIKRSAFMIVVNESIADEVMKIHKLQERPIVVRNIPPKWNVDQKTCEEIRKQMLEKLSGRYLLMYHGAIVNGRGIEKCIELLACDKELCLVVLGTVPLDSYKEQLEKLIDKLHVKNRVVFYKAVSPHELWKYIGAVDISMVIVEPVAKSYYLALPNKLFESIQAYTPVVGTDLPEIKRIICKYKVGEVCKHDDIADIYRAVRSIKENQKKQEEYRKNEREAAKELCWESESKYLEDAYKTIWKDCNTK